MDDRLARGPVRWFDSLTVPASIGVLALIMALPTQVFSQPLNFNIPSRPLDIALREFGVVAEQQVAFDGATVQGKTSKPVIGRFEPGAALGVMLAGSNLRAEQLPSRVYQVVSVPIQAIAPSKTIPQPIAPEPMPNEEVTVVVTGIRKSMADAVQGKRLASRIMDTVSSEDIGKLPDQNTAEAVGRVPGVQVSRLEGQGTTVSVRGISLNKLLFNGNNFVGSGPNGDPALRDLPPELLAGVDVIKAPSADLQEGWLGAIINVRTKRPFELPKSIYSLRVQGSYADSSAKFGDKESVFYSHKSDDGKFGFLLSAVSSRSLGRSDQFSTGGWTESVASVDVDGNGSADTFFRPLRIMEIVDQYDDRRWAANVTLQWRPIEALTFTVDGLASNRKVRRARTAEQLIFTDAVTGGKVLADGTLSSGTVSNITVRPLLYVQDGTSKSDAVSVSLEYKKGAWSAHASLSRSEGSGLGGESEAISSVGNVYVLVTRQLSPVNTASVNYQIVKNAPVNFSLQTNFDRLDASQYEVYATFDNSYPVRNSGHDVDLDLAYRFDHGVLTGIKTGIRTETIKVFSATEDALYPDLASVDPTPTTSLRANEVQGLNYGGTISDFMAGASGSFPRVLLTGTADPDVFRAFLGATPPAYGSNFSKQSTAAVEQASTSVYVKLDFAGSLWGTEFSGDTGLREQQSRRKSIGYMIVGSDARPLTVAREFRDVLPSFNITFKPQQDLHLRFAAAKVLARPPLTSTGVGIGLYFVNNTGSAGNPDLKPFNATQLDGTAEWYFGQASMASLALFTKRVSAFTRIVQVVEDYPEAPNNTTGQTTYLINRPLNGEKGTVNGFEINYQQELKFLPAPLDGFGYSLNYTFAVSDTPNVDELTAQRLPLPNASKDTFNGVFFYEKGRLRTRLAYNYRSQYLIVQQGRTSGGSLFASGRGQIDASASFALTSRLRLTFEGVNLGKKANRSFVGNHNRTNSVVYDDRRVYFGIAGTF